MRYFAEIAYNGAHYFGWQRQPNDISVQEQLETSFSTILRTPIDILGCGRTDTGVHARQYYFHFDYDGEFPEHFVRRLNKFLPPDIAVYRIFPVAADAHARFDAYYRAYAYIIDFQKNPFAQQTTYHYPYPDRPELEKLQAAAALLLEFDEFFPFCKTHHDARTLRCELHRSDWEWRPEQQRLIYHIAANRFLRGMVRLIVGMCINVGLGKLSLDTVRAALEQQQTLERSTSAPPQGLFLTEVRYPNIEPQSNIPV